MPGERIQPSLNEGLPNHDIQQGVEFKPFEEAEKFYTSPVSGETFHVPEQYEHSLYLRRPISLHGMQGAIDIISEDPYPLTAILMARVLGYRTFTNNPYGEVDRVILMEGGKIRRSESPATLRFSFSVQNPLQYTKLLTTYGNVKLAEDDFYLTFNLNQPRKKENFTELEKGNFVQVNEKNIFNLREIQEIENEYYEEPIHEDAEPTEAKEVREFPERISFVHLPVDLNAFRNIQVRFDRFEGFGEHEYPEEPILPNRKLLPV